MKKILLANLLLIIFLWPAATYAQQDTLALSVTPPLMNINLSKNQEVATSIRIINNNSRPVTVYIEVVDFRDNGNGVEYLTDQAIKDDPAAKNIYLSRWVTLTKNEITLEPFRGEEVPFIISVPAEANPGGHYAALWIGTNPPDDPIDGSVIKISSKISSLILARVAGQIDERGAIREFSVESRFSGGRDNAFSVRFENFGNIHLRPQGVIRVSDMFGKTKGKVLEFNTNKDFGNVLPGGDREWEYKDLSWRDEDFFLFNRYKAELSLSFGEETKQTDARYVYFWAVDWKWLAITLAVLGAFLFLLLVVVKAYVRQSVKKLQRDMLARAPIKRAPKAKAVKIKSSTVDLRKKK